MKLKEEYMYSFSLPIQKKNPLAKGRIKIYIVIFPEINSKAKNGKTKKAVTL